MILVITVNYNNAELTNETIKSIYSNPVSDSNVQVIVVDNNSEDKDVLINPKNVRILRLENNIGYFPAINEALKQVDFSLYEYIVICNNDLEFDSKFFEQLQKNEYQKEIFAICPRIIDLDSIDQNPMLDKKISRLKVFFYDLYYKNFYFGQFIYKIWQHIKKPNQLSDLTSRRIFMGYGAIYILTRNFFQNNLILDSPPFLMFEETFLAHQIYKQNGIEYFDSSLIVHHKDHSTCSKVPKKRMYNICKESYKYFREKIFDLPTVYEIRSEEN